MHGDITRRVLNVYDTLHAFGKDQWTQVEWMRTFTPGSSPESVETRLRRMDRFCRVWGIELQRTKVLEGQRHYVVYRKFTDASKRRVDKLLGPVLSESESPEQDLLRSGLGTPTPVLQSSFS